MLKQLKIADIKIGKRHRKDMGDLTSLADSIRHDGLLQPIGVTDKFRLVFGERRLRAQRDVLKKKTILARKPLLDSFGPRRKERDSFMNKPGLYAILGDHPLHGARSLLYIGQTASFGKRFEDHDDWVKHEWRVEVYLALLDDDRLREDVEALFIFAHTPHYNSKSVANPPSLAKHLRVWNEGRYWKLFPEVSSQHKWYVP